MSLQKLKNQNPQSQQSRSLVLDLLCFTSGRAAPVRVFHGGRLIGAEFLTQVTQTQLYDLVNLNNHWQ